MNYSTTIVPSTFPPDLRPIYIYPIAELSFKTKETAYPIILSGLETIIRNHMDDRILVHTVSFAFTDYLHNNASDHVRPRMVSYRSSQQRQRAIDTYLYTPTTVLLAPSLDRGIDFPGNDCRAIVVAKIPYPQLNDKQISARLHSRGGQLWYTVQAVRSLVQMTGRGMRSANDFCETYILDRAFISLWRKYKHLFPTWWRDALIWDAGKLERKVS